MTVSEESGRTSRQCVLRKAWGGLAMKGGAKVLEQVLCLESGAGSLRIKISQDVSAQAQDRTGRQQSLSILDLV